ncbi:MAG: hypothetical protein GWO07_10700 [Candidatus Dadabacteria bacterium]|nr:hypothetical protein [Candidatus Dadabacteria bacterium]NIS09212.1 hypothetical protein [Candidatus Dadabacteria bacterium]NIV43196.1 hypothetical protein [Candidatus Dadabacteria bacterium]NIY22262.1 hypothetical protein [Candidatus Dadabacteria bacterium]
MGTWDPDDKTCTLNMDLPDTCIDITDDDVTLKCDGHTIDGDGTGEGVIVDNQDGVSIQDFVLEDFQHGIFIEDSQDCEILNNTVGGSLSDHTDTAIFIDNTDGCTIRDNTVTFSVISIFLAGSDDNVINGNRLADTTDHCLLLTASDSNDIMENDIDRCGKTILTCSNSIGPESTAAGNGIHLINGSDNNIIIKNDSDFNADDGYEVDGTGNKVRKNDADFKSFRGFYIGDTSTQCKKYTGTGNVLEFSNVDCD